MQSKVLERSISTALTKFLLPNAFLLCPINLKRTLLNAFLFADINSDRNSFTTEAIDS